MHRPWRNYATAAPAQINAKVWVDPVADLKVWVCLKIVMLAFAGPDSARRVSKIRLHIGHCSIAVCINNDNLLAGNNGPVAAAVLCGAKPILDLLYRRLSCLILCPSNHWPFVYRMTRHHGEALLPQRPGLLLGLFTICHKLSHLPVRQTNQGEAQRAVCRLLTPLATPAQLVFCRPISTCKLSRARFLSGWQGR